MTPKQIIEKSIAYLKQLDQELQENRLSVTKREYDSTVSYVSIIAGKHSYLKERKECKERRWSR